MVDETSGTPLHAQIARHLRRAIEQGDLLGGDRLDGEIGLAERWGVSRATLRRAISDLVSQGVLLRQHGVGTQVAPDSGWHSTGVRSMYDELAAAGRHPVTRIRAFAVVPAGPDVAEPLGLELGTEVYAIERLRFADGVPLALMRNWLPATLVPLAVADLDQGLYELLRARGVAMRIARQSIGAQGADDEQAEALGIEKGSAVLSMDTVTYAAFGQPIEVGRHVYRADNFRFQVTNVDR